MNESKIELTERLRREGRWSEASRFKDTAVKDFRSKGMKKADAGEAAWQAMEEAYPPLQSADAIADPVAGDQRDTPTPASSEGVSPPSPQAMRVKIPPDWGALPENVDPRVEVKWVAANLNLCRGRHSSGPDTVDLARAASKAPSWAAIGLMEAAVSNPNKFMLEVYPKFIGADDQGDEAERDREERLKIEEIEECLENLRRGADEELRANVPAVVQQRVRDMLSNWVQHCGVSIAADAWAQLDSDIVGLIRDCMRAVAPSSGGG